MNREEAKKLYEGKFFYEVVKHDDRIELFGPKDDIYYVNPIANSKGEMSDSTYKFVQVVDGKPVQAFTEEEILVIDRKL